MLQCDHAVHAALIDVSRGSLPRGQKILNRKDGRALMKKRTLFLLLIVLGMMVCGAAFAQTFTFSEIHATCKVSDDYILLTPDNLEEHPEWVANQGATIEETRAAWAQEGVLLEAWNTDGDVRIRVTAVQDEQAKTYYDLDQQPTKARTSFRTGHDKGTLYSDNGIEYTAADWKKISDEAGRFLAITYKQSFQGVDYRGYMRRTIRNGYTITVDYRVTERGLKAKDKNALVDIMTTWAFTQVSGTPSEAAGAVSYTELPPDETNTGEFTVEGTCQAGMQVVGVVMRMSSPEPMRVEDTAGKSGKFSLDVTLPEEGTYLMTVTVLNGDTVVDEKVFNTTVYQKNLLPINLDAPLPTELTGDDLVISGTTVKNVTVQCMMGDGYHKQVKTNNSGRFSFKIDTSEEGTYDVVLAFSKKGLADRRMSQTMTRVLTEADRQRQWREEAVKPAYSTLTDKLEGYTGRVMVYNLYAVSYEQSSDGQWTILMAMDKKNNGYRNYVVVTTSEEPKLVIGSQAKLYARCTGSYTYEKEDGSTKEYPSFELLFWD